MNGLKFLNATIAVVFWAALAIPGRSQSLAVTTTPDVNDNSRNSKLSKIQHIVVIYQENHSFDNLYGGGEGVDWGANTCFAPSHPIVDGASPQASPFSAHS